MIAHTDCAEDFSAGWAMRLFSDRRFHRYRRDPDGLTGWALCRPRKIVKLRLANGQPGLFIDGDFPLCKRCEVAKP